MSLTPGPWKWDGKFTVIIPRAEGDAAFRTFPDDARAIAALPELLAFVKRIAAYELCGDPTKQTACSSGSGPYCQTHDLVVIDDDVLEARALIAKAEGR